MINFRNDYSGIAHEKILEAMMQNKYSTYVGYGLDEVSKCAEELILNKVYNKDAKVYFLTGGTITNKVFISHVLEPYEAVISVDSGHINVHETGTIEQGGHKIITCAHNNGKINPQDIQRICDIHTDEHMVKPKLVYITNATEYGTIYKKQELVDIYNVCKKNDLYLYIDGARLGVALTATNNDITLEDLGKYSDAFYIGGTKNGAILGEALVVNNKDLQKEMRYSIKHFGGMYAKGFVAGMQFKTLFENDLYFEIARKQNELAEYMKTKLIELGIKFEIESDTNQLFPIFSKEVVEKLSHEIMYEMWTDNGDYKTIRFVAHFLLTKEEVDKAIDIIKNIL